MVRAVLDASAVLALLQDEAGSQIVADIVEDGLISPVNMAEVVTKLIERGMPPLVAGEVASGLGCKVATASLAHGLLAGQIHARTKGGGLSLGDRFCLSLAEMAALPVITADRAWAKLDLGIEVVLIR